MAEIAVVRRMSVVNLLDVLSAEHEDRVNRFAEQSIDLFKNPPFWLVPWE